ncbi:unnamed protein product [Bursaphelenchus okinawaensis]|uniref:Uncharacterized protein n=1 Tax=Bursaphelenchus okinawaensis TaxID=465554 RepID=A0A811K0K0_9BILA|nr:unnamed protein product [Bursaphelenchus okinawaensis]CAG9089231.1 unnamed protein product [Bursaphelenchus okinawaensis]
MKRAQSKQNGAVGMEEKSALQHAKNFLRRLYNTSTFRLKQEKNGKSTKVIDPAERFKTATSPFYEMRLPQPEERPFLPYNIRYEVEDEAESYAEETSGYMEEDSSVLYSNSHLLNTPASTSSGSSALNHSDEGVFSGGEDGSTVSSSRSDRSFSNILSTSRSQPQTAVNRPNSGMSTASSTALNSVLSTSSINSPAVNAKRNVTEKIDENDVKFKNWNQLFEHLRKEITEMRARDKEILENLMTIEEEIRVVKHNQAV